MMVLHDENIDSGSIRGRVEVDFGSIGGRVGVDQGSIWGQPSGNCTCFSDLCVSFYDLCFFSILHLFKPQPHIIITLCGGVLTPFNSHQRGGDVETFGVEWSGVVCWFPYYFK